MLWRYFTVKLQKCFVEMLQPGPRGNQGLGDTRARKAGPRGNQGLGETLAQHENKTPLFLSPKHHHQQRIFKGFIQKHILHTIEHAGSLADRREPPGAGDEPLASRLEHIGSLDNLLTQTHLQPITHTQVKERVI